MLAGSCHCGANGVELLTAREPEAFEVRSCQCRFCLVHGALSVSDPQGELTFRANVRGATIGYRFGLKLADFLLCGRCGAYLGAYMPGGDKDGERGFGVINLNVLAERARFGPARAMTYEGETIQQRLARRRARWTPARRIEVP